MVTKTTVCQNHSMALRQAPSQKVGLSVDELHILSIKKAMKEAEENRGMHTPQEEVVAYWKKRKNARILAERYQAK